jgi:hypothetical protein
MKKFVVAGALLLSMALTLGFASNAAALGRAAGLLISTTSGSVVGLIDFDQNQFMPAEANQFTGFVSVGANLIKQFLGAQFQTAAVTVFTPSQMTSFGLGDADTANTFILQNLASLNVDLYVKAVITKVEPPPASGATGQNLRMDLYLYAGSGTAIGYVGSLEISQDITSLLGGLLTF